MEQSFVPIKYCNTRLAAPKSASQGLSTCASSRLVATYKSRRVFVSMNKRLPTILRYLVPSYSIKMSSSSFLGTDLVFIGVLTNLHPSMWCMNPFCFRHTACLCQLSSISNNDLGLSTSFIINQFSNLNFSGSIFCLV